MNSRLTASRFTATFADYTATSRVALGRRAVLYGHGTGSDATECGGAFGLTAVPPIVQAIADRGFPVATPTETALWGNTTGKARLSDAYTAIKAAPYSASTGTPFLLGISHGAPCVLRWHQQYGARAAVLIAPAIDMEAIRTADTLGTRAGIDAAHGVIWAADRVVALPAGVNPADNTADYTNLPMQIWGSSIDTVSANVDAFVAATGAEYHDVGALPHGNSLVAAVDIPTVIAFLEAHA